jgi:hypothetical protein
MASTSSLGILVMVVVFIVAFVVYIMSNRGGGEITKAEQKKGEAEITQAESLMQSKIAGKKFEALGDSIKTMTIEQISAATGLTERGLRARMIRHGLVCANYDGDEIKKRLDAEEGKSAPQLSVERIEKQTIGTLSSKVKCPHCDTIGQVYKNTNATQTETTQSARLTAILLEGERITTKKVTQFHCKNCETTWNI